MVYVQEEKEKVGMKICLINMKNVIFSNLVRFFNIGPSGPNIELIILKN